jgi:hypothetical protein
MIEQVGRTSHQLLSHRCVLTTWQAISYITHLCVFGFVCGLAATWAESVYHTFSGSIVEGWHPAVAPILFTFVAFACGFYRGWCKRYAWSGSFVESLECFVIIGVPLIWISWLTCQLLQAGERFFVPLSVMLALLSSGVGLASGTGYRKLAEERMPILGWRERIRRIAITIAGLGFRFCAIGWAVGWWSGNILSWIYPERAAWNLGYVGLMWGVAAVIVISWKISLIEDFPWQGTLMEIAKRSLLFIVLLGGLGGTVAIFGNCSVLLLALAGAGYGICFGMTTGAIGKGELTWGEVFRVIVALIYLATVPLGMILGSLMLTGALVYYTGLPWLSYVSIPVVIFLMGLSYQFFSDVVEPWVEAPFEGRAVLRHVLLFLPERPVFAPYLVKLLQSHSVLAYSA